jgi:nicotinamidase-related amidase
VTTALLLLHMQVKVVDDCGPPGEQVAARLVPAVEAARAHGIPVIHVRLAYRPGLVDAHPPGGDYTRAFEDGQPGAAVHPSLWADGDLVIDNKRASAFKGSGLDVILSSLGADHLVLTGIGTGGVVLATTIEAADLDYRVTVPSDGCDDPRPGLHQALLDHVIGMRAAVPTLEEWIAGIPG